MAAVVGVGPHHRFLVPRWTTGPRQVDGVTFVAGGRRTAE